MTVYEGNEKYIFISYAHKDSTVVLPIIKALQDEGFRVWYDGGIEAGTEWPEYIADHLARCAVALLFISENALASQNCIREINFAISEGREMLAVYLSNVKLSRGMKMQLGTIQALYRRRFLDEKSFISALLDARIIAPCNEGYVEGERASEEEEGDDLSAFFGAERQKKRARERATLDYADSVPVKIYKGTVSDEMQENITENARIINTTFGDLKIRALVSSVEIGPRVTTYHVAVDGTMRVNLLTRTVEDLKFALGVNELRILPPSGKDRTISIEILNGQQELVPLDELMKEARLREEMGIEQRSDTSVCLGRAANGEPVFRDIAAFPHLLMSGITQTGKTTLLHSMIVSMITRVPAERLGIILVDLKGVEFDIYADEPHMLLPVIHDSASAARVLTELCDEMERRYKRFMDVGARTLDQYNELAAAGNKIPRIVFIVDDYADLIYTHQKEIGNAVMRLSQKARAAGIYIVLSTQRPTTNSITGVLKANIPTRLAFRALTQADSRAIIDDCDAMELSGHGDALFSHLATRSPMRLHTPYVSVDTVIGIVKHLIKKNGKARYNAELLAALETEEIPEDEHTTEDALLSEAIELAIELDGISVAALQRRLSIGYNRAMKILQRMVSLGIVSSSSGPTPRKLLITREDWEKLKNYRATNACSDGDNDE